MADRVVGVSLPQLGDVPEVIAVAYGSAKARAVGRRSGLASSPVSSSTPRWPTGCASAPGWRSCRRAHLHISALVYPRREGRLTNPRFEADRKAVADQTVALVSAAGRSVG